MNDLERSLAFRVDAEALRSVRDLPGEDVPKISVIIPSLNQGRYISQALDSVLEQEYPSSNLEVFVADGGSTDETVSILREYRSRTGGLIQYISERDRGQYHAVNKGIRRTNGDIIAWLNSDDVYMENAFWNVVTFFHYNRCALIVYGKNKYTNESLGHLFDYPTDWSPLLSEQRRKMMHFCLPPQPSTFFKRDAVKLSGALQSHILDYELWLRWQNHFQFYFIDEYLSLSRLHEDAKTIRDRTDLIKEIINTSHQYYGVVSMNWALALAYHEEYGNEWMSGRENRVTAKIRMKAKLYWLSYNLKWLPRSILSLTKSIFAVISDSVSR